MKKSQIARLIITAAPLAVLFTLYGLRLFQTPPVNLESVIASLLFMVLVGLLYYLAVPRIMFFYYQKDVLTVSTESTMRTNRKIGAREVLVILCGVVTFRIIIIAISYYFFVNSYGYNCTIFTAQRMWSWWSDAPAYMTLASKGSIVFTNAFGSEVSTIGFLPLYSYIARAFAVVSDNFVRSGYFVSHVSALLGCYVLYLLVNLDYGRRLARKSVKYFCILPAAFLFYATMADSLFFLLSVTSLYFARKKHIPLAAVFGSLAAYTKLIGLVLILPLAMECAKIFVEQQQLNTDRDITYRLKQGLKASSLLLIPLATGMFLIQNYALSGDSLSFLAYQQQDYFSFYKTIGLQFDSLISSVLSSDHGSLWGLWLPNVLSIFLGLGVMTLTAKRIRASYLAYFIAYFIFSLSVSRLINAPRLLHGCFPLILGVTLLGDNKYLDAAMTIASVAGLIAYLYCFVSGYPVY